MGARTPAGWLVLLAAVGLIAIVALASRTGVAIPAVELPTGWSTLTLVEIVGYVALGVGVFAVPVVLLMYRRTWRARPGQKREQALPDLPWVVRFLGLAIVAALVAVQILVSFAFLGELQQAQGELFPNGVPGGGSVEPGAPGSTAQDPTALIVAAAILVAIAVIGLVVVIRLRMRDRPEGAAASERRRAAHAALEVSLEALRREPDPRRAVIAAYGAMEQSLAKAGFGRHSWEAPLEYLRRVLDVSGLAHAHLRTITMLFQHARFSDHPVPESMRTEAIEALGLVRATLGERA